MDQGYAGFTVRDAYTPLIPLSHRPSGFRHWSLSEFPYATWRSYFSRINRRFHKPQPLRPKQTRNPRGLRLTTEPSTTPTRKTEALPSASCTQPCLPLQRPGSHGTSISRFALTFSVLVLLVYSILRLQRLSGLSCSCLNIRSSRRSLNISRSVPMRTTA